MRHDHNLLLVVGRNPTGLDLLLSASTIDPLLPGPAGGGNVGIDGVNPAPDPLSARIEVALRDNEDVLANDGRTSEDQQDYSDASPT